MTFPIKPLEDRLIVMQAKTVVNKGGSVIQITNQHPTEGEVIAVGPDVKGLKVGDYVIFADYSGQETPGATTQANGIPILLREREILALVDVEMVREMESKKAEEEDAAAERLAAARAEHVASLLGPEGADPKVILTSDS